MEDIKIVNRQVDTAYLFNKVKCHQNLFYEIFHIKNVLKSLISCIDCNSPDVNDHLLDAQPLLLIPKSNIYKSLVKTQNSEGLDRAQMGDRVTVTRYTLVKCIYTQNKENRR